MYCGRYKKKCDEALYLDCDVPTSSNYIDEQIMECQECVFCEVESKNARTLEY